MSHTAPTSPRSTIRRARRDIRSFIALTECYDGQYMDDLTPDQRDTIWEAATRHLFDAETDRNTHEYWPSPLDAQHYTVDRAPYFTLETVRGYQERLEALVHVCDYMESFDEFEEYIQARDAYHRAKAKLGRIARDKARETGDSAYLAWPIHYGD